MGSSTHQFPGVALTCDEVLILHQGVLFKLALACFQEGGAEMVSGSVPTAFAVCTVVLQWAVSVRVLCCTVRLPTGAADLLDVTAFGSDVKVLLAFEAPDAVWLMFSGDDPLSTDDKAILDGEVGGFGGCKIYDEVCSQLAYPSTLNLFDPPHAGDGTLWQLVVNFQA